MSEINLGFVVEPNNINIVADNNNINFTPSDIQLSVYTASAPVPGGSNTQLQYNNNGLLGGIPNVTYNGSKLSLGNVANVLMTGGTNGYVLQTDGTGNLSWTAQSGNGGNGTPGGANTQIQYNDAGSFGGNAGFTFNEVDGNVNMPANLIVAGTIYGTIAGTITTANFANYAGNVTVSSQPNITSLGNLTNLNTANANLGNVATANYFVGEVLTVSQPYITSLGNLTALTVQGMTTIQEATEKVTANSTGSTGTINYDVLTQAIYLKTSNATANFTLNIRGNSSVPLNTVMSSNQSLTCTYVNINGATGYYANVIQIDGTTITPKWVYPGAPTVGTSSGVDAYTFNILKTAANTYTVLASKTGFI